MMTLFAPVDGTALTRVCMPATLYENPAQSPPPCSQHRQPAAMLWLAWSGYGSLNRSKMTASLALNPCALDFHNRTAPAPSCMVFWHVCVADAHSDARALYCPACPLTPTMPFN